MSNLVATQNIQQINLGIIDEIISRQGSNVIAKNTKRNYRIVASQYNKFVRANELSINDDSLILFFDELKERLKPGTLNTKKYELASVIKAYVAGDSVIKNLAVEKVFQKIDTYQIEKTIPLDECLKEGDVKSLIENATSKTALIIEFLWLTACRVSEAANIKHTDIKRNEHVKISVVGKGNKQRTVYITGDLLDRINKIYQGQIYLFESKTGRKLNRTNITMQVKKVGKRLGYDISAHSLRHARATHLLIGRGFSLKAVSKYLGHSTTAITADMYIHDSIMPEELFS